MTKRNYPRQNFSLGDMKGEKWDDIPGLDGAYLLSNYGRIKSLRREIERLPGRRFWTKDKILSTKIRAVPLRNGHGNVYWHYATISFEKRRIQVPIARMVYFLFVRKFKLEDRTVIVRCRDGNAANICPENLELVTLSATVKKAYQLKHRPRTSFSNDATAITQYDIKGKWLANFPSASLAKRETGIPSSTILAGVKRTDGYAAGFIWKKGSYKKDTIKVPLSIKKRETNLKLLLQTPITRYDLRGRRIAIYPDLKTARHAMKTQTYPITCALKGIYQTVKGSVLIAGKGPVRIDATPYLEKRQSKRKKAIWRPVLQLNDKRKKIREYPSIAAAARSVHLTTIQDALKNKNRTAGGFYWQYK